MGDKSNKPYLAIGALTPIFNRTLTDRKDCLLLTITNLITMKNKVKWLHSYIKVNYENIVVREGKCRFNYKCHLNSIHEANRKGHSRIAMVVSFNSDSPYIHFINVSNKGTYRDNTLGYWVYEQEMYLIKYVNKEDFKNIGNIFTNYRKELKSILPFRYRVFHKDCDF